METEYMLRALEISKLALPNCRPNPPVGCVLVKDDKIVAEGFTQEAGKNHAEVEAIHSYSSSMTGATLYVTLEPCSFHGRTPSCAKMLIERGINQVVVGILDPDSRNNGKGINMLMAAGISVHVGLCSEEILSFLLPYLAQSQ